MPEQTIMAEPIKRRVCLEACEGVSGARPDHPRLRTDVDRAVFLALRSPTFREYVRALDKIIASGGSREGVK